MTFDIEKLEALAEAAEITGDDVQMASYAVLELTQTLRDLKSSVQGLKTGYEAYERVNAELRAEIDRLNDEYDKAWRHDLNDKNNVQALAAEVARLSAECEALRNSSSCVDDLSALVRQLVQHLRKASPDNDLPGKALDYLKRKGLQGSPLRAEFEGVEVELDTAKKEASQ